MKEVKKPEGMRKQAKEMFYHHGRVKAQRQGLKEVMRNAMLA